MIYTGCDNDDDGYGCLGLNPAASVHPYQMLRSKIWIHLKYVLCKMDIGRVITSVNEAIV